MADDPSHEVQSPKNFTLPVGGIKPPTAEQSIEPATAHTKNVAKKWGVTGN